MGARRGRGLVVVMGAFLASTGLACDWVPLLGDPDLPAPTSPNPPAPDALPPTDGPGATTDAGAALDSSGAPDRYELMCRHYCQALDETDALVGASTGAPVAGGEPGQSIAASCFDLRCVPHRVDVSLCLAQCDSLANFYDARCPPLGPSPDPLCPTSQAEHDAACRAGCVL